MKTPTSRIFMADFETTVYAGQERTEVWAAASVEFWTEKVRIHHSIREQFEYFNSLRSNLIIYYHNLKFDGAFWLSFLLYDLGYTPGVAKISDGSREIALDDPADDCRMLKRWELRPKEFIYNISEMGQWYSIIIRMPNRKYLEIRDSMKLLPFSVRDIGYAFKTRHQKLDMEYTGFRFAGCPITEEEQRYIANDVLVVKEALELMFADGHNKLTIGSCCLAEYKATIPHSEYELRYPNLFEYPLDKEIYGADSIGAYIRKSYHGGWCYLVPEKANQIQRMGVTVDCNSLYPSMMHSESGNLYPYGLPHFWRGNAIPPEALAPDAYYFVRARTRFHLKPGMLPTIQIKHSFLYPSTQWLATSDVYDRETGEYAEEYTDLDGHVVPARVTMTMTMTDFQLMRDHYNLSDFEILDGCYFPAILGPFNAYIDKWREIKIHSKGGMRTQAKLFLNNLYGKMAASPDSSFKVARKDEDQILHFYPVNASDKKPGYIPIGSAITSYSRNFTIRAAQANYYGPDQPGFIYADTDSMHCTLRPDQLRGITIHPQNFCAWKVEGEWDLGLFVRQKTYLERIIREDGEQIIPTVVLKCAGMPQRSKDLFLYTLGQHSDLGKLSEEEEAFIQQKHKIRDFTLGLKVPGKLLPKRIPGGIVLEETTYKMR